MIGLVAPAAAAAPLAQAPSQVALSSPRLVRVPILRQALRNNCETAALSMLLAARGMHLAQLELQRELTKSFPLDPIWRNGVRIWGDPNLGFVGRAAGGGTAGGYGVYQWPIAALAARHGVALRNLSGHSAAAIYRSLRAGRPVLVWVALSSGPYARWRTPAGRSITANFGEHTVVLSGIEGTLIRVNDPIDGQRKLWSRPQFEAMWIRMGRRALGLAPS